MTDPFRLDGRRALVTGANTGIGQAIALGLARAGAHVVAAGRSPVEETLALIAAEGLSGEGFSLALDDPAVAAGKLGRAGPLDILVNNAGIIRRADAVDFAEADWDDVIDVNLKAVFFLSQAFARAAFASGRRRRHRQHRLAARLPGRHPHPELHRRQARRRRPDQAPRQRVGGPRHQRQRHRPRLHRDQQHRGAARRPRPQQGDPRPHPRRPLGRAVRHRRRRRLPRLAGGALHPRHHPARRRRLACPLTPCTAAHLRCLASVRLYRSLLHQETLRAVPGVRGRRAPRRRRRTRLRPA